MARPKPLDPDKDPEVLLGERRHPKGWTSLSYEEQLEYIATRILAEDRHGTTSHSEIKESGILSVSQYERRRNREVYTERDSLDSVSTGGRGGTKEGVFSRVHTRDIRGVRNPEDVKDPTPQPDKKSKSDES
jgi:hypothetical protein